MSVIEVSTDEILYPRFLRVKIIELNRVALNSSMASSEVIELPSKRCFKTNLVLFSFLCHNVSCKFDYLSNLIKIILRNKQLFL